jgi:hypothetical protein
VRSAVDESGQGDLPPQSKTMAESTRTAFLLQRISVWNGSRRGSVN